MAKFNSPRSRTVVESSSFLNPKSRHEHYVNDHHFNYAVDLFLPGCSKLPSDLQDVCPDSDTYWFVKDLPLTELVQMDFIQKFLKKGDFYALSSGTKINTDNVVALLPSGDLILSVTKDTYEELGLDGKVFKFDQRRRPTRYMVEVSLTSDCFKKGKPGYERVQWCFKDRLNLTFDFLVAWKPSEENYVQLESYWNSHHCRKVAVNHQTILRTNSSLSVPVIDSCHLTSNKTKGFTSKTKGCGKSQDEERGGSSHNGVSDSPDDKQMCGALEVFEWLGAVSCEVKCDGQADSFISTYACPEPNRRVAGAVCHRWTGFITPNRIAEILKALSLSLHCPTRVGLHSASDTNYLSGCTEGQLNAVPSFMPPHVHTFGISCQHHVTLKSTDQWAALTVHGFADSPVSWGKREHGYDNCGENLYTFVIFPEDGGRYWYIVAAGAYDDIS